MNFPPKMQISKPIDVSVFMFDLRMISMSSECEYDWCWKISACSTEYEVCDSFASLTRQQTSYSGSAGWYFRYQSIHIQITYTYPAMVLFLYKYDAQMCIWYIMLYCNGQGKLPFPVYFYLFKLLEFKFELIWLRVIFFIIIIVEYWQSSNVEVLIIVDNCWMNITLFYCSHKKTRLFLFVKCYFL